MIELQRKVLLLSIGVAGLFNFLLVWHLPVTLYAGLFIDDAWYISKAQSIVSGHWFGSYDQMTLIKGPTYPLFLALNHFTGLPANLVTALVFVVAIMFLAWVLRVLGLSRLAVGLAAVFLLLDPALFPVRVVRDNIYVPLMFVAFTGLALVCLERHPRVAESIIGRPVIGVLSGVTFGLFWLTREEGVWLLPGLAVLVIGGLYLRCRDGLLLRPMVSALVLFAVSAAIPIVLVSSINAVMYGKFVAVSTKSSEFTAALDAMQHVSAGENLRYVPVSAAKRKLIYGVSPSFRQLAPYFEGTDTNWKRAGCRIYPESCGDYAGGWYLWALRDAVALNGHSTSAADEEQFYAAIAAEISAACISGALQCTTAYLPFVPPLSAEILGDLPGNFLSAIIHAAYHIPILSVEDVSSGRQEKQTKFTSFLRLTSVMPDDGDFILAGWYRSAGKITPQVMCDRDGQTFIYHLAFDPIAARVDNATRENKGQAVRADIVGSGKCHILVPGKVASAMPLSRLSGPGIYPLGDGVLEVDKLIRSPSIMDSPWVKAKSTLLIIYKRLAPILFWCGIFAFVGTCVLIIVGMAEVTGPLILAAALWASLASRCLLLAMVDATSFPAINSLYLQPAYALSIAAATVSIAVYVGHHLRIRAARRNLSVAAIQSAPGADAKKGLQP